jgi:hypothetical protein
MTECKVDVIKCSRCKFHWEIVRGEHHLKLCERCRAKKLETYRNRSTETIEKDLARRRHHYDTDEAFRLRRIVVVTALSKTSVVCSECDKAMNYGSLRAHKKCCKGPNSITTLQKLMEFSVRMSPLFESNDSD